jgi:hypothetical protein
MGWIACRSVVELYVAGRGDSVLDALQQWATDGDGRIRTLAAATLVELAYLKDEAGLPLLLPLSAQSSPHAEPLVELWRAALQDEQVKAVAWEALWRWCRWADREPELLTPLNDLFNAIGYADEELSTRLDWYLGLWQKHPKEPSITAEKILSGRKE